MKRARVERQKALARALVAPLGLAPLAGYRAEARRCGPPLPIERALSASSAVFVGTVTATEVQEGVDQWNETMDGSPRSRLANHWLKPTASRASAP